MHPMSAPAQPLPVTHLLDVVQEPMLPLGSRKAVANVSNQAIVGMCAEMLFQCSPETTSGP